MAHADCANAATTTYANIVSPGYHLRISRYSKTNRQQNSRNTTIRCEPAGKTQALSPCGKHATTTKNNQPKDHSTCTPGK